MFPPRLLPVYLCDKRLRNRWTSGVVRSTVAVIFPPALLQKELSCPPCCRAKRPAPGLRCVGPKKFLGSGNFSQTDLQDLEGALPVLFRLSIFKVSCVSLAIDRHSHDSGVKVSGTSISSSLCSQSALIPTESFLPSSESLCFWASKDIHAKSCSRQEHDHSILQLDKRRLGVLIHHLIKWHKMKYVKSSKISEVKTSQKNAKNVLPRHQRSDHHVSLITLKAIHCRKPDLIHICWISWQQPCAALITQQLLPDEHQLSLVRCQNDDGGFGYTTLHQIISQPDCHVCFLSVDLRQTHLGFALTTWVGPQKDVWCNSGHFTTFVETAGSHFPWNRLGPTSLMVFDRSDITVIPQREINGKHVAISALKCVEEAKKSKKKHLWNQNQKLSFSLVRSHTSFLIRRCTARTEEGTLWSSGARMRRSNMEMLTLLILASWTATKIRFSWTQGRSADKL